MKRVIVVALSILAISAAAFAQSSAEIDKALLAAPRQLKEGATVIKWKSDFTYETLKKGTNRLVCYDRSGQAGQQPFAVECTSIANLERAAQNLKLEAQVQDKKAYETAFTALEKEGKWIKPEFGSVWIHYSGCRAGCHDRVPGPPRQTHAERRMDHERGLVSCPHHGAGQLAEK